MSSQIRDSDESSLELSIQLAGTLAQQWSRRLVSYKSLIARYFLDSRHLLPDEFIERFLSRLEEHGHFSVHMDGWRANLIHVLDLFFFHDGIMPEVRCSVINILKLRFTRPLLYDDRLFLHELVVKMLLAFPSMKVLPVANVLGELLAIELGGSRRLWSTYENPWA